MSATAPLLALLLLATLPTLAQFPKAYMADAVAGPARIPPAEGPDAKKLLILSPAGLAIDSTNNIYVSDEKLNRIVRITPSGSFTTYAGNGIYGNFKSGIPANQSGLAAPHDIAFDRSGNLYIANKYASTIVQVAPSGIATIYAGGGSTTGDGRPPTQTKLGNVEAIATDAQGNLYFCEFRSFKIRKIPSGGGAIETFAGTGTEGYTEANGPAKQIPMGFLADMFFAPDNSLYLLDSDGAILRRITSDGTSTFLFRSSEIPMRTKPEGWTASRINGAWVDPDNTLFLATQTMQNSVSLLRCPQRTNCEIIAGGTNGGFSGDGTPATQKRLAFPSNLAKDSLGNLVFTDQQRVRLLTPTGELKTLAGGDEAAARGDGLKSSGLIMESSSGIAIDAQGNVYASDMRNHQVWRFGTDGLARLIAGTGTPGYSGDGGPARSAELNEPGNLALDSSGNLYILDVRNFVVRRVTPQGTISTLAGKERPVLSSCPSGGTSSAATQWCFAIPAALTADPQGNVWVADYYNIVKISGGTATALTPSLRANALHYGADGNLYAAANNQVFRSTQGTGAFTPIAGTGKYASTGDGGLATAAELVPSGLGLDPNRNLIIADSAGRSLRAVTSDGKIRTIAGGGNKTGVDANGAPSTNSYLAPAQLAFGSNGRIYLPHQGFSSDIFDDIHVWMLEPAQIFRTAVLNAASYTSGAVAGGEMITIYGLSIGPSTLATYEIVNGKFRDEISSTRVLFDGIRAPIIYVSDSAASVIVPYGVAGKTETELWIETSGTATNHLKLPVALTRPGVFTIPPTGTGQAALLHWPDYSVNRTANPLAREGVGMLFLTGGGEQGQDGVLAQTTGALPFPVTVLLGGVEAQVLYAGPAPTLVYGMLQINFIVPASVTPGDKVSLYVRLGETWSQSGLTIAVK